MTGADLGGVAAAALVGGLAPFFLRRALGVLGAVDVPNERSSHLAPTTRGGGLAPLCAILLGGAVHVASGGVDLFLAVLIAGVAAAALGFVDDVRGLRVSRRLPVQVLVGAAAGVLVSLISGASMWSAIPVAAAVVVYVNVANFMDGIDGISSLHGFAAGSAFAFLGAWTGLGWLTFSGALLAVAFVVFLPWNLLGSRMFLGDAGSYLLGAALAVMAAGSIVSGIPVPASLAPLSIYLADTLVVIARRLRRGEHWWEAHRQHVYQRLVDSGARHLVVSLVVTAFGVVSSGLGALALLEAAWAPWVAAIGVGATVVAYLLLPRALRLPPVRGDNHFEPVAMPEPREPGPIEGSWAVVGASGFVGSAIVAELRRRGREVVEVRAPRVELSPRASDAALVARLAAQRSSEELVEALRGASVVVNAAGAAEPGAGATSRVYGANALLPAVVALAAEAAGADRVVHLSSAAVQGRRAVLDETPEVEPFSPYSRSKALGERALLALAGSARPDIVIVRATSVQGTGRRTTESLRAVARSAVASVARPGTQPSAVSSVGRLAELIGDVGSCTTAVPRIVLQPWEGLSVQQVLEYAGGRAPRRLPRALCAVLVATGRAAGALVPGLLGAVRRVEVMWFGQAQVAGWAPEQDPRSIIEVLQAGRDE